VTANATAASFDNSGHRIVYADDESMIYVRDLRSGEETVLGGFRDQFWDVRFSDDGDRVAAASEKGALVVWRLDRPHEPERVLRGHDGYVVTLAFSPDGALLASAGADRTLLWEVRAGALGPMLEGHAHRVDAPVLEALEEGEERAATGDSQVGVRVIRSGEVAPPALDLVAPLTTLRSLWLRFRELGVQPAGTGVWETLRIEKGRPAFGVELDPDTLPPEAGIHRRAIDHAKGCYTGQEVIVRIRDRGKVNRHLRGLLMGDLPHPEPGTPLFIEGRDRAAGEVRSAAQSPRFGQGIGLGYLRRELEPPGTARLGEPGGPELQVRALSDDGWVLAEGDPGRD
jgi:folate-binding protein YgfZ